MPHRNHLLTLSLALAPVSTLAQIPCAGTALTGSVRDTTSALLPDATVTLDDAPPVQSGADGRFTLPCLAPGMHKISVAAEGFSPIVLTLKAPRAALDITLRPAVETTVEVSGDTADTQTSANSAGPSQTLAGKQLQQLADDPDDLLREVQQMASGMGGNPANATITVDGFQDSTQMPPKSSIAYIKVNPDLFSSEYREPPFGNGGRVEIYTKPGQPTFHGALFTTNGSPFMNARDPFSTSKAALGKQRYGFELGGPIRKQGSDFFTSLEYRRIDNFAVINAVQLTSTGAAVPVLANVPQPERLWLPNVKVDWQLSPRNTFIAGFTGTISHLENVGVGGTALAETGVTNDTYDDTLRFANITTVNASLMHESRVSIRFDGSNSTPLSTAPQVQVAGAFTGGGSSLGAQHLTEVRTEVDDDAILTTKQHTLKAGVQFFFNSEHRRLTTNFNGSYIFGGGTAAALDTSNQPIAGQTITISGLEQYRRAQLGLLGGTATAFTGVTGDPNVNFHQVNAALFVQDDWKLPHGFLLSSGLRYYTQTQPLFYSALTPRLGILWAPGKEPKWTVHAHAGMFAGTIGVREYQEVLRQDGIHRITSTVYNPIYGAPFSGNATTIQSARSIAPGLTDTLYGIYNIGGTRDLPHGLQLQADLGYGRLWNYARSNNINAPFTNSPTGPRPSTPNLNLLQVQNSGQGYLDFVFVGISNHTLKRVQFFAGAVHIDQFDNTNDDIFFTPQNSRSDVGEFARRSDNAPWQVFGNFTLQLPAKLQFSGNFYGNGDQPFNITTGFDNNGDGNFNDRPQVAAPGTSGAVQTRYGFLVANGGTGILGRDSGRMPWTAFLDANLQRAFKLTRDAKADHQQTLTVNVRSSNVINHTNVTAVGSVFASPLFDRPYDADHGRRVEAGLRYSF